MATRSVRRLIVGGALGAVLALVGSGLGAVVLAADHAVAIAGFAFSPKSVTIAVGDTVTWTNADAPGHTATADDASFDTGTISTGNAKSVTFSTAGTFGYHCKIHPAMTATIVVAAAAPATDTVDPGKPGPGSAGTPWLLLVFAAAGGLALARRRFARPDPAAAED